MQELSQEPRCHRRQCLALVLCWALSMTILVGCDAGEPSDRAPEVHGAGSGSSGGKDAGTPGTGGNGSVVPEPPLGQSNPRRLVCDPHPADPCLACLTPACCLLLLAEGSTGTGAFSDDGGVVRDAYSIYDNFFTCLRACVGDDSDAGSSSWEQLLACGEGCGRWFVAQEAEKVLACTVGELTPVCRESTSYEARLLGCAITGRLKFDFRDEDAGSSTGADPYARGCADICFPNLELPEP